jgi:hypothetical protein
MKNIAFVALSIVALAACSGNNQDAVENAELNQPAAEVNVTDNMDAANSEAAALGTQQQQLEDENAVAVDNTTNPTDEEEQNVAGM